MKPIIPLMLALGLAGMAPLAHACPTYGAHHGGHCLDELDTNHDGAVSRKEFDAFHAMRFKELDRNQDGKLSEHELQPPMPKRMPPPMSFEQRFDDVDINHDGALSRDEAEIGMPRLFQRFDAIDADQNGKLSKEEVMVHMRQVHPPRQEPPGQGGPAPR